MSFECPIDCEPFSSHDDIVATPCGHVFHRRCAASWLENSSTCPDCREKVTEDQLIRLYLGISDEVPHKCQAEVEEAALVQATTTTTQPDAEAVMQQLEMTEMALFEERDRLENLRSELDCLREVLHETERTSRSVQDELNVERIHTLQLTQQLQEERMMRVSLAQEVNQAKLQGEDYSTQLGEAAKRTSKLNADYFRLTAALLQADVRLKDCNAQLARERAENRRLAASLAGQPSGERPEGAEPTVELTADDSARSPTQRQEIESVPGVPTENDGADRTDAASVSPRDDQTDLFKLDSDGDEKWATPISPRRSGASAAAGFDEVATSDPTLISAWVDEEGDRHRLLDPQPSRPDAGEGEMDEFAKSRVKAIRQKFEAVLRK